MRPQSWYFAGRLAGLLSRVPRWHGQRKRIQQLEQTPESADVSGAGQKLQGQEELRTTGPSSENTPRGMGASVAAASQPDQSPLAVCLNDKLRVKKKEVEAALGTQETQLLYERMNLGNDGKGNFDFNIG